MPRRGTAGRAPIHHEKGFVDAGWGGFLAASAGTLAFRGENVSLYSRPDDHDRELAGATVRQMTNRSMAGLTPSRAPRGGFSLTFKARFQAFRWSSSIPKAIQRSAVCRASKKRLSRFFGRNLATR